MELLQVEPRMLTVVSCTITDTTYLQLNMEATALDFGMRQFCHLFGSASIQVVTDHHILVSLWKFRRQLVSQIQCIPLSHHEIEHHICYDISRLMSNESCMSLCSVPCFHVLFVHADNLCFTYIRLVVISHQTLVTK